MEHVYPSILSMVERVEHVTQSSKSAVSQVSNLRDVDKLQASGDDEGSADLEVGDTAGLETCATVLVIAGNSSYGRCEEFCRAL